MPPTICPYLGVEDDPETALHYPSAGNYCYHARPVEGVNTDFQATHCLTAAHRQCPVYLRSNLAPLPSNIAARKGIGTIPPVGKGILGALAALVLISAFLFLGGWNQVMGMLGVESPNIIPLSGGLPPTPFQPGAAFTPTRENDPLLFSFTASPLPTRSQCPPPEGWVGYVVNPTDSLALLSIMYNIPLDQLRTVNCLSEDAFLQPGEVIYVPFVATMTPTSTSVASVPMVPVIPFRPSATLPRSGGSGPAATATLIPTVAPTFTLAPTLTGTTFVTWTPLPTWTLIPTATLRPSTTPTNTPQPTRTRRPTRTPQPSSTPQPTTAPTWTQVPTLVPTSTTLPPTNTPAPTDTQQPTATEQPPTATSVPPTATSQPPTDTAIPPTETSPPPTATTIPPTETSPPPTATAVAPTATSQPPTATSEPPTATAVDTPAPVPSDTTVP